MFADLITLPLLLVYRKYYGTRLLAWFWAVMAAAGVAVEGIFALAGAIPKTGSGDVVAGWESTRDLMWQKVAL